MLDFATAAVLLYLAWRGFRLMARRWVSEPVDTPEQGWDSADWHAPHVGGGGGLSLPGTYGGRSASDDWRPGLPNKHRSKWDR